ncbi:DUF55-domain-containing protein [Schizophyllum commune]
MSPKYWLLKAEPDSRVVKGKDVKFSVDDFEAVKTSPWEGVRNYEARNLLREMKVGDKVLFYHSNCKNPGIAGFAEISKEAYPDYTAWDPDHPYYDPKTNKDSPKWYMPDVTFVARAAHLVPLSLLRTIASAGSAEAAGVPYIGKDGVEAIKGMALITRGRLSVQRVEESAWNTIQAMAEKGGWEEQVATKRLAQAKKAGGAKGGARKKAAKEADEDEDDEIDDAKEEDSIPKKGSGRGRKRKADDDQPAEDTSSLRRSSWRKTTKS